MDALLPYEKSILDSGLRVITSRMPATKAVSLMVCLKAGPRYEADDEAGISHFLEHLCFKGTTRRPGSSWLCGTIEGVGGIINGGTDQEMTVYWSKVTRSNFALASDVLSDMVQNSLFASEDVQRERQIILEEISMSNDSPQQRVDLIIDELLWPDQPLGRDVAGTCKTVCSLDRDAILDYWRDRYTAQNAVVSVAGDVEHSEVVALMEQYFRDWRGNGTRAGRPADNRQDVPRLRVEPRETEQLHLALAVRGLSAVDPDRFALDLASVALGEGMSSRLFTEVREKRGLAYDVHSYVGRFLDAGALIVYAGVEPARVEEALSAILTELSRLKEPMPPPELRKTKEMVKGHLLLGMEDSRAMAGWVARQELLLGRILTPDDVVAMVERVTADEVAKVAQQLLVTNKLSLGVVGPVKDESRIRELLCL